MLHVGGTSCWVRVVGACPSAVVELTELAEQGGLPLRFVFPALADLLCALWFECGHEPVWVEYRPQRALAELLLGSGTPQARHRVVRTDAGLAWSAMSFEEYAELMA